MMTPINITSLFILILLPLTLSSSPQRPRPCRPTVTVTVTVTTWTTPPTTTSACVTVTDTAGPNCPPNTCLPADCIYLSTITQSCGCDQIYHVTSCKTRCDGACSTQYQTLYLPCPGTPPPSPPSTVLPYPTIG
ncbi:hypothetical protein B0O99DRAFT_188447 [Bisporella sp. PMI_857]|nr:hypothetical protein B0O99DRAFT_188447 [Bisporella sp. PMI_857]